MEHNREKRDTKSKRKRKKRGGGFKVIMTIVLIFVITMAMLACMAAAYIKNVIMPEADLNLDEFNPDLTSTMYCKDPNDPNGNYVEMQDLYAEENRVWVTIEDMPQDLLDAAVAIEDKRFYKHNGVDWVRTARAVLFMFTGTDIQGGSTLTQQLIKNITTEDDVTVKRKVTEIFRALEFEKNYNKEDILEWYLNYIYLGQRCNGVYTASYKYFGKHVSQLSLAECASLIGITNNPSKYDPLGHLEIVNEETGEVTTSRDFNKQRQELILNAMLEQDYITKEEYEAAIAEELNFDNGKDANTSSVVYTWYEDAVINQVLEDLMETYDWSEEYAKTKLFSGGLKIYTCMNPNVQAAVDAVYNNPETLNVISPTGQRLQSAITVVDNETGDVVAMAGGLGGKTGSRVLNRATDSLRPPGSSIKPLTVYAPAIQLGYITPSSTYVDSPDENGWPVNASGVFQGTVSIAKAVRESINTVAVKVLEDVGAETSFEFMRDRFRIQLVESRAIDDKNFTDIAPGALALGGLTDGVRPMEMAAAYSVFPRMGTYKEPRLYAVVLDANDKVLLSNEQLTDENALSERTCYYMNQMLQGVVNGAGGTGRAANFAGQDIAGKTGTTTSRKDLWFVGYTPYYTAAVWTGYDQQERLAGGLKNPSTGLWNQVMSQVHLGLPYKPFPQPDTSQMTKVTICSVSGKLPGPACTGYITSEYFFTDDVPTGTCTVHRVVEPEPEEPVEGTDPGTTDPGATTPGVTDPGATTPPAETPPVTDPAAPVQ